MPPKSKFNITEENLLGFELEEIQCKNCSDICGSKTPRLYHNRPIVICGGKEPGQTVLANLKAKR